MDRTSSEFRRNSQLCRLLSTLPAPIRPALVTRFDDALETSSQPHWRSGSRDGMVYQESKKRGTDIHQSTVAQVNSTSCAGLSTNPTIRLQPALPSTLSSISIGLATPIFNQGAICAAIATAGSRAQMLQALIKSCVSLARKLGPKASKIRLTPAGFPGTSILLERNVEGWSVDIRCLDDLSAHAFSGADAELCRQFRQAGLGKICLTVHGRSADRGR